MPELLDKISLYAGRHAIEVVNFTISLAAPIDEADMRRFEENKQSVAEIFPAISSPEVLQIPLSPGLPTSPPPKITPPKMLSLFGGDGKLAWNGQFGDNLIAVSCHAYTRWDEIWPLAKKRLACLAGLVDPKKPVWAVDYSVTDTFSAKSKDNVLLSSRVFKDTPLIPSRFKNYEDPRWDFSYGWFEETSEHETVLKRIDGRSVIQGPRTVVRIVNAYSYRPSGQNVPMPLHALLKSGKWDVNGQLDRIFNMFHDSNKSFLMAILEHGLLVRMGLEE